MFYARHFKNFANAELEFDQPVTLLVGPNGAGKSNIIEAVELLAFLAAGRPLHEVTELGREGGLEVRGGLDTCATIGQKTFTLGFKGQVATPGRDCEVHYEISIRVGDEPRIVKESLSVADRDIPIFEVLEAAGTSPSADNTVRYDNYARGKNKPNSSCAADRSALSQYARFAHGNQKLAETLLIIDAVTDMLSAPAVFDPIPKLMRSYERISESKLARNGFNVSSVLYDLYRDKRVFLKKEGKHVVHTFNRKKDLERIRQRIAQLPDEPFSEFDFVKTKADDVMFTLGSKENKKLLNARVLSDGTLRALAILTALETTTQGSRLILEEFDNGVHPSRVQVLADALFDCATRRKFKALVTTHNPATLNALTDDQLASVLFVIRYPGEQSARMIPLTELPGCIDFLEKGRLGDLITKRIYEQHLTSHYEDDRAQEIEKWLETLP